MSETKSELVLHGYWRSSCSYRVRIALELKQLTYRSVPVNLIKEGGEQYGEAYRSLNPMGQVPLLEDLRSEPPVRIGQSVAILEYLEEAFAEEPRLLPENPADRARVRQLTESINSGVQPLQNLFVLTLLKEKHGVDRAEWSRLHIRRGLKAYEEIAKSSAGEFSVGSAITIAECALIPQLYNARRFNIDVEEEFPLLASIDARCQQHEAFAAAHPDQQPDAVKPA